MGFCVPVQSTSIKKDSLRSLDIWCRRRDLNPHGFPHTPLKRARIPIPPRRHIYSIFNCRVYLPSRKTIFNRFSRQSATSTYIFNFQQKLYYHKHNFCKILFIPSPWERVRVRVNCSTLL